MKYIYLLLIASTLAFTGCSVDYGPDCRSIHRSVAPSDISNTEIAYQAWRTLSNPAKKAEWPAATKQYNDALLGILNKLRCEKSRTGGDIKYAPDAPYAMVKPDFVGGEWTMLYEDVIPCADVDTSIYLREKVFVNGMGIPLAGIVKSDIDLVKNNVVKDNGNVHTITAILDFDHRVGGKPALKVVPRLREGTLKVGKQRQPIAADFTTPIALFWAKTRVDRSALLGLFNPKKAMNYKGLYFSEPYDPTKIPVLFTHGLMSSPVTFANLVNRLQVDPVIRKNYQFWYFSYPSGEPWVLPARDLRDSLKAVFAEYDPKGTSQKANKMVVVGHSMGGLITRLNNSTRPWSMITTMVKDCEDLLDSDYEQAAKFTVGDPELTERTAGMFVFEPSNRTRRIVFMATPHRGSDFADRWLGHLGRWLISIPETILTEVTRISTLSSDMLLLNPERLVDEFTSISQLSPKSTLIRGVQLVHPDPSVPVHSIIGDRGRNNTPRSSDGIVKYSSSHLNWAVSETIVPSGHSVQECIPAANEMKRILREHLQAEGISTSISPDTEVAPTIWQDNPIKYYFQTRR